MLDDVIELGPGDKIVVDGVVLAADGLEVDESLLTGESDPVHKQVGDPVLSGSFVTVGTGAQQATKVGREAYAAQLAEEASRFTLVDSELRAGINRILQIITYLLVPAAALIIWSQFRTAGTDVDDALRGMVAALVPMVPEGLVLLTSIAFAVGVIRLGTPAVPGPGAPGDRGPRPRRRGLRRQDRHAHRERHAARRGATVAAHDDEAALRRVLGALAAADPRPNASLAAVAEQCPSTRLDGASRRRRSPRPASGAARASTGPAATGCSVPRTCCSPRTRPSGPRRSGSGPRTARAAARAGRPHRRRPTDLGAVEPAALVVLEQRVRPEAADTLAYFAEQDVEVKVISGDNALSVGAVAASLGLPSADAPVDARTLPADRDELADVARRRAPCSVASRPRRSATWWGRCSRGATPSR